MPIAALTTLDFDTFHIDGLPARMEAIKSGPRPKLQAIGQELAPWLTELTGTPVYAHIAMHARRKVNPPTDTWVALAANRRGYKMVPHFQVGLWSSHLFIQAGVIYEAAHRARFAQNLLDNLASVQADLPDHFRWLVDYTQPEGKPHAAMTDADFRHLADRLTTRKQADAMVGLNIPRAEATALTAEALDQVIRTTIQTLLPIYLLASA